MGAYQDVPGRGCEFVGASWTGPRGPEIEALPEEAWGRRQGHGEEVTQSCLLGQGGPMGKEVEAKVL